MVAWYLHPDPSDKCLKQVTVTSEKKTKYSIGLALQGSVENTALNLLQSIVYDVNVTLLILDCV